MVPLVVLDDSTIGAVVCVVCPDAHRFGLSVVVVDRWLEAKPAIPRSGQGERVKPK